jgi:hypothetical protein
MEDLSFGDDVSVFWMREQPNRSPCILPIAARMVQDVVIVCTTGNDNPCAQGADAGKLFLASS